MNPALTAIANSLRVGDHLLERLGRVRPSGSRSARAPPAGARRSGCDGRAADGESKRGRRGLCGRPRPGRRARHVPGGQLDPDEPRLLRADEHGLRRPVPAAGGRGDLGGPRRRRPDAALRREAGVPGRARRRRRVDDAARRRASSRSGPALLPYAMLLLATTSLGIGFGLVVPAINTLASGVLRRRPRIGRSCTSTRCSGWERRSRRCWSRSSSGSACGGACRRSSRRSSRR